MAALLVHLAVLATADFYVPVVQPAAAAGPYAFLAPAVPFERAAVFMNTNYGDPSVKAYKKKDPKTGSTKQLFGYRTGSRAPPMSIRSGTIAEYGYGISNRDGGQFRLARERAARGEGTKRNTLLGGAGTGYNRSGIDPKGFGPIFCWVGVIILIGSYFKFSA